MKEDREWKPGKAKGTELIMRLGGSRCMVEGSGESGRPSRISIFGRVVTVEVLVVGGDTHSSKTNHACGSCTGGSRNTPDELPREYSTAERQEDAARGREALCGYSSSTTTGAENRS